MGRHRGRQVTHAFASQGAFVVTLTETNDRGIAASDDADGRDRRQRGARRADFTTSPQSPGINDTVFFNASISKPGTGSR